jgi:hypothetical protein
MSWGETIPGAVYVAVAAPFAKIGMTVCSAEDAEWAVARRVKKLSKGVPLPLRLAHFVHVDDCPGVEAELLRRFTKQRVVGEWVKAPKAAVVRELKRLAKGSGA